MFLNVCAMFDVTNQYACQSYFPMVTSTFATGPFKFITNNIKYFLLNSKRTYFWMSIQHGSHQRCSRSWNATNKNYWRISIELEQFSIASINDSCITGCDVINTTSG